MQRKTLLVSREQLRAASELWLAKTRKQARQGNYPGTLIVSDATAERVFAGIEWTANDVHLRPATNPAQQRRQRTPWWKKDASHGAKAVGPRAFVWIDAGPAPAVANDPDFQRIVGSKP